MKKLSLVSALIGLFLGWGASIASAEDLKSYTIVCNDGTFSPSEIEVPANTKFKLIVKNEGKTAEEFESLELNREKIIAPGQSIKIFLGPLPAGKYGFFGEFHAETAKGNIIVK